ncbi:hypothetical protein B0A48_04200 [Cryoendolithus antarcticus]|uniref:Major facilitator superfamily (MFS) profile domain-containing protein n=1 Tax=Cryoendolithus antarcticus TaxID=1507870 RepID=A0A1V8TF10_9PEZI|nr:hypothetical protein B0A48_04200 [Cryoendolithus antarcticus]
MPSRSGMFKDLTPRFVFVLFISTIGPLLFGYHLAELNAPQDVITCVRKSIGASAWTRLTTHFRSRDAENLLPQCIPMDPGQFGLVSSIFTLGGLVGALTAGPVSAKQGRLRAMIYNTSFYIVGAVIEAFAPNLSTLVIGRVISGLGAGASLVVVPIWISETAPPGAKGFWGAGTQIMTNVGILIAQVLGYFLSRGSLWRFILLAAGMIAFIQAVGLLLGGQESPKWLAENGRGSDAKRALRRLRGHAADIEEEINGWGTHDSARDLDDEREALMGAEDNGVNKQGDNLGNAVEDGVHQAKSISKDVAKNALGVFDVLKDPNSRPAIVAVMGVMLAQQLCGINSIVMYGVSLLAGLLESNSALLNILVAVLNIFVTTAAAPLPDKIGRKACLLISIAGMGTNSILLGIGIMKQIPLLSAIAVLLFVASFGIGLGPVPFILSSELVGPEAVGATQSWALAANWVSTFAVAQFFPLVNANLPAGHVYFLFAGFALFFGIFVAWRVPETRGKGNADEVWGKGKVVARED